MRLLLSIALLCASIIHANGQDNSIEFKSPLYYLKVSGNIHLELIFSDRQELVFVSEGNSDDLEFQIKEDGLHLKTRTELSNSDAIEVKLYYVHLRCIKVLKGGRVQSADTIKSKFLELDVVSGGKTELIIHVDSLDARVNQGADIILYGTVGSQHVNAYSWGNYLAFGLEALDSYVKAATGAQVKVTTSRLLDANATSKAYVGYSGNPVHKKIKTSVGGEVTPSAL